MKAKQIYTGVVYEITKEHYEVYRADFEAVEDTAIEMEIPMIMVEPVTTVIEVIEDKSKGRGRPKK